MTKVTFEVPDGDEGFPHALGTAAYLMEHYGYDDWATMFLNMKLTAARELHVKYEVTPDPFDNTNLPKTPPPPPPPKAQPMVPVMADTD